MRPSTCRALLIALLIAGTLPPLARAQAPAEAKDAFAALKYRNIGPMAGGRICRVCGVAGDPRLYYAATASGGVWKSTDGGIHWHSLMDDQPISSAGSIAVAPSDPNVIYVGAGEANIRGNVVAGNGIYKSTDAGKTWKHIWKQKGQIGALIVHPKNPAVAFAAVLGHVAGPNGERGVFRTQDGGLTWKCVLFKDADTGASDVCFDPSNPTILFAGLWQARRKPWELISGGPGSGLYTSRDGGDTWEHLGPKPPVGPKEKEAGAMGNGLPLGPWGKVGVAIAPADGQRIYALIEADKGGLYRSDDGGKTWKRASADRKLRQRAWYYSTLAVDPINPDRVYCPQVQMLRSVDGGRTIEVMRGMYHGDNHDLWIDPADPRRMILGNDGGVNITTNGGKTWYAPPLPISQFYRIAVDAGQPYTVAGTIQDLGSAAGPSNSLSVAGIRLADWYNIGGGETGYVVFDRADPNYVYAGEYAGIITRFDYRTREVRNISIYPENPSGHGAADMKHRFRWPAPIAASPHDPKAIYHAGNVLFKTTDRGQHWTAISGDLTRNDRSRQQWSGGPITGDNTTAEFYCTISAVAESPKQPGLIWVGSDDGLVHRTRDGGKTWTNLTEKLPRFPEWATVQCIEPSPHAAGTAYVVIQAQLLDDDRPFLFKTTDYGETWTVISERLPQDEFLHVMREDPAAPGLLAAGTSRGVYLSADGGETWRPLKLNLPTVPIVDLLFKDDDLVVATSGRSLWIFDDLSPIRLLTQARQEEKVALLPALPAIRWVLHGPPTGYEAHALPNPPAGAVLHYFLAKEAKEVRLEIRDARAQLVARVKAGGADGDEDGDEENEKTAAAEAREYELPTAPGVHRIVWPLTWEGATAIKKAVTDLGSPKAGLRINPGRYTARLTVDGQTYSTPIEVRPDPRRAAPAAELAEQERFVLDLRGEVNQLTSIVEKLRLLKRQAAERNSLLEADADARELVARSKEYLKKLDDLEERLHNPRAKISYDILALKGGAKLYSRLVLLYTFALTGDGAPTQGMREVAAELKREFDAALQSWKELTGRDLTKLNELAGGHYPILIVPKLKDDPAAPPR
jgi:photosystem II stability/assembly factor-like uncharacterized protein